MNNTKSTILPVDCSIIGQGYISLNTQKTLDLKTIKPKNHEKLKNSQKFEKNIKNKRLDDKAAELKFIMNNIQLENQKLKEENAKIAEENLILNKLNQDIVVNINFQQKLIMRLTVEVDRLTQNLHNVHHYARLKHHSKGNLLNTRHRVLSQKRIQKSTNREENKSFDDLFKFGYINFSEKPIRL